MRRSVRVQMLLTDAFGSFGGISQFNRDFLAALNACSSVERVHALPRLISEPIEEVIPEAVIFNRKAARGRVAFARQLLRHSLRAERADLVICGHLHLLPLAWLAARYQQARLVLIVHGFEAFGPTRHALANLLVNRIDAFIAVSRYSADRFVQWSNVARDRGFILPNCVDLNRFHTGRAGSEASGSLWPSLQQGHADRGAHGGRGALQRVRRGDRCVAAIAPAVPGPKIPHRWRWLRSRAGSKPRLRYSACRIT